MSDRTSIRFFIVAALLLLGTLGASSAIGQEVTKREVSRTKEKDLTVSMDVAFGTLTISKGDRGKIVVAEYWCDERDKQRMDMWYSISNDRGDLEIELTDSKKAKRRDESWISKEERREYKSDYDDRHLTTKFTDAIPIAFKVALGAGKGDLDVTGLKIARLKVSAGASSADLRCDEPNDVTCDEVVIESGVSKFAAEGLSNLNFRRLKFEGGIGTYKLDFGGKLRQSATAEIEVGLGAVIVYVPRDMPARIIYDSSWFSSLDVDDDLIQVKKSVYETEAFKGSRTNLTIRVESGLGSVKLRTR